MHQHGPLYLPSPASYPATLRSRSLPRLAAHYCPLNHHGFTVRSPSARPAWHASGCDIVPTADLKQTEPRLQRSSYDSVADSNRKSPHPHIYSIGRTLRKMSVVDAMSQPSCHAGRADGGSTTASPAASAPGGGAVVSQSKTAASRPPHDAARFPSASQPMPRQCDEWPRYLRGRSVAGGSRHRRGVPRGYSEGGSPRDRVRSYPLLQSWDEGATRSQRLQESARDGDFDAASGTRGAPRSGRPRAR